MKRQRHTTLARLSIILSMAMASGATVVAIPQPAAAAKATERWCYCGGTTCGAENWALKWCCTWDGTGHASCGCSYFITNCQ